MYKIAFIENSSAEVDEIIPFIGSRLFLLGAQVFHLKVIWPLLRLVPHFLRPYLGVLLSQVHLRQLAVALQPGLPPVFESWTVPEVVSQKSVRVVVHKFQVGPEGLLGDSHCLLYTVSQLAPDALTRPRHLRLLFEGCEFLQGLLSWVFLRVAGALLGVFFQELRFLDFAADCIGGVEDEGERLAILPAELVS